PTNAEEIYIGGINVWKSNNGGSTFSITSHWVHPSGIGYTHADIHVLETFGNKVYCGSDGGVFKSSDAANSWIDITFGLQITQFYGFGSSETNPNLIIGGAQDNGTNLWSNSSWTHVIGADGMEALIDWYDPQIMYGSIQNGSLQKSTDGGVSFNGISSTMTDVENANWVTPYDIDPVDHNTLYAGYENLWKTTDGGNSWYTISNFTTGALDQIAIAPSNPDFIYVSVNSIMRMTFDGGTTWSTISNTLPGYTITDIAVDPESHIRVWITYSNYADGNKISRTDDGGITWTNVSGSLPNLPANCIATEEGTYNGVYIGMDAGIFYTNDTISDWLPYFENLPNVIINELEVNEASGKVRAATYGRGIWESNLYTKPLLVDPTEPDALLESLLESANFTVFPNPTDDAFTIRSSPQLLGESILIYDRTGKLVLVKTVASINQEITLSELPSGIYLVKINDFKTRIIKR
ncbi:MAG: T9SS type A sorting domain-containing protein, partial [Flavobacteriales bacterium]|nr:T9SS type A sorting domain-containing protein [Flavobacteriales bacterium]